MNYKIIPGSVGVRKSFQVTCGLRVGYDAAAVTHTGEEAVESVLEQLKFRAAAGLPYLTGTITTGEVVYAWSDGPGKAGGGHEPVIRYEGEVNPLYNKNLLENHDEVVAILNELGIALGAALGQTRIYLAYDGQTWILEAEKAVTPTGN
jgi:hypothetical protein